VATPRPLEELITLTPHTIRRIYRWNAIASERSNALLQVGHFLMRFVNLFSTHSLQNACPHPFRTVFLNPLLQIEQTTIFCSIN